jgi:predicted DNA-binding protein (MmcQ/YjbR family)
MPPGARTTRARLLRFALGLPGAWVDHPWGEEVAKVGTKVFVFFGPPDDPAHVGMTVKLDESHPEALAVTGAEPSGYGLGRSGWVTIPFRRGAPPAGVLEDWIEESYRRIAPKRQVAELDRRHAEP